MRWVRPAANLQASQDLCILCAIIDPFRQPMQPAVHTPAHSPQNWLPSAQASTLQIAHPTIRLLY